MRKRFISQSSVYNGKKGGGVRNDYASLKMENLKLFRAVLRAQSRGCMHTVTDVAYGIARTNDIIVIRTRNNL